MEKWRSQFNTILQEPTVMIAQIQTTSNHKNRSSRNENKCNSNESISMKSASSSANHATNPESSNANNYKSTTFENPTINAKLLTQPDQEKENSYHTLVSTGTTTLSHCRRNTEIQPIQIPLPNVFSLLMPTSAFVIFTILPAHQSLPIPALTP